ncbi:hypothetical protein BC833DRAFT_598165 [Globomyces pollinis-pini]|nr:hypothetical protein BC833DRAFT_598165 [Globomyces pollinis-pini]
MYAFAPVGSLDFVYDMHLNKQKLQILKVKSKRISPKQLLEFYSKKATHYPELSNILSLNTQNDEFELISNALQAIKETSVSIESIKALDFLNRIDEMLTLVLEKLSQFQNSTIQGQVGKKLMMDTFATFRVKSLDKTNTLEGGLSLITNTKEKEIVHPMKSPMVSQNLLPQLTNHPLMNRQHTLQIISSLSQLPKHHQLKLDESIFLNSCINRLPNIDILSQVDKSIIVDLVTDATRYEDWWLTTDEEMIKLKAISDQFDTDTHTPEIMSTKQHDQHRLLSYLAMLQLQFKFIYSLAHIIQNELESTLTYRKDILNNLMKIRRNCKDEYQHSYLGSISNIGASKRTEIRHTKVLETWDGYVKKSQKILGHTTQSIVTIINVIDEFMNIMLVQ